MSNKFPSTVDLDELVVVCDMRVPDPKCLQLMVESFRRHGFQTDQPLTVDATVINRGTVYLIIDGNRRFRALCWLRDNEPETYQRVLPFGQVPVKSHLAF